MTNTVNAPENEEEKTFWLGLDLIIIALAVETILSLLQGTAVFAAICFAAIPAFLLFGYWAGNKWF